MIPNTERADFASAPIGPWGPHLRPDYACSISHKAYSVKSGLSSVKTSKYGACGLSQGPYKPLCGVYPGRMYEPGSCSRGSQGLSGPHARDKAGEYSEYFLCAGQAWRVHPRHALHDLPTRSPHYPYAYTVLPSTCAYCAEYRPGLVLPRFIGRGSAARVGTGISRCWQRTEGNILLDRHTVYCIYIQKTRIFRGLRPKNVLSDAL